MLQVSNLTFTYQHDAPFVLEVPQWSCSPGARVAIVGRSGSGKTTFLKCLAGLLQPTSGSIVWAGERVKGADERLVPGNDVIKLVQQDFGQDPHLSVIENLRKYILEHEDEERATRIERWLEGLNIAELGTRKTLQLSGGQLQRVALAQSLLAEPEVLLLDEPFSNLDPIHKHEFIPALRGLFSEESTTTISVLHDPIDALRFADEIVVFQDGRIVETGSVSDVFYHPKSLETVKLFGMVNIFSKSEFSEFVSNEVVPKQVEDKFWLRPSELKIRHIQLDYHVVRELPMPSEKWIEILVNGRLLVVSE